LTYRVQWIAFFVGGDHGRTFDVREASFQLFQRGADQVAEQFFGMPLGVHLDERGQPCGRLHVQMNRVPGVGQAPLGAFFPVVGKLADFHIDLITLPLVAGWVSVRYWPVIAVVRLIFRLASTGRV